MELPLRDGYSSQYAEITGRYSDGMPRVSIDGESHGTLTLVACLGGILVAVILIIIIIITMDCGKVERFVKTAEKAKPVIGIVSSKKGANGDVNSVQSSKPKQNIFTSFFSQRDSFDIEKAMTDNRSRHNSVSTVLTDISWNTSGYVGGSRETVFTIPSTSMR